MKKGSTIVQIRVPGAPSENIHEQKNTVLVAALLTLGIPLDEEVGAQHFREKGKDDKPVDVVVWTLKPKSLCGKYKTAALVNAWDDKEWLAKNPEHPLTYMKTYAENHRRMVAHIKDQGPIVMTRRGKKIALITRHTTPERRERIFSDLNK